MAIRLEKAGWSSAGFWLSRQTAYDLAEARKNEDRIRVERYRSLPICIGFRPRYYNPLTRSHTDHEAVQRAFARRTQVT